MDAVNIPIQNPSRSLHFESPSTGSRRGDRAELRAARERGLAARQAPGELHHRLVDRRHAALVQGRVLQRLAPRSTRAGEKSEAKWRAAEHKKRCIWSYVDPSVAAATLTKLRSLKRGRFSIFCGSPRCAGLWSKTRSSKTNGPCARIRGEAELNIKVGILFWNAMLSPWRIRMPSTPADVKSREISRSKLPVADGARTLLSRQDRAAPEPTAPPTRLCGLIESSK